MNLFTSDDSSDVAATPTLDDTGSQDAPLSGLMLAADNHNLGNQNSSLLNPDTWEQTAGNIGKFALSAAVSGVDSVANSAIAGANLFSDDDTKTAYIDTAAQLANLDDNLGAYYAANKQSADLAGFLTTSMVPGLAGVKLLNASSKILGIAAETGLIGENVAAATGLLRPVIARSLVDAGQEIATSQASFNLINANVAKSLALGIVQNTLEGAAFQIAVDATMFQSPVLENQDLGDKVSDLLYGSLTFGLFGGALEGVGNWGRLKSFVKSADEGGKPFTKITELPEGVGPSDRIIQRFDDMNSMADVLPGTNMSESDLRARAATQQKLGNLAGKDFQELAGGDSDLANTMARNAAGMSTQDAENTFFGITEMSRLGQRLEVETELAATARAAANTPGAIAQDLGTVVGSKRVGFIGLLGDDAGNLSFQNPPFAGLSDSLGSAKEINAAVTDYGFTTKKVWSTWKADSSAEAEARFIWADRQVLPEGVNIGYRDIPLLEAAREQKLSQVNMIDFDGTKKLLTGDDALMGALKAAKEESAVNLHYAHPRMSTDEIARMTNTSRDYLEGQQSADAEGDLFARQKMQKDYTNEMVAKGLWDNSKGLIDTSTLPRYAKVGVDYSPIKDIDGNYLTGLAHVTAKSKLIMQGVQNVFAKQAGTEAANFLDFSPAALAKTNRYGAGPKRFSGANGDYLSPEMVAETNGAATGRLKQTTRQNTSNQLDPVLHALASNPEAAVEWSVLNNKIAGTTEKYVLSATGDTLVPRALKDYMDGIAAGDTDLVAPNIQEGAPHEIAIENQETLDAINAHISVNGQRVINNKELYGSLGRRYDFDPDTFYPIRPNPKDYPNFALVRDPSVVGAGHTTMIHAKDAATLQALTEKVPSNYQVIFKQDSREFHEALGDFTYERTLHEDYMNASLKSKGINSQFFTQTDPQKIVGDILDHHMRADGAYVNDLVHARFNPQFSEMERLAEQFSRISGSTYAGDWRNYEETAKNPYLSYVKTSLGINNAAEFPLLKSLNDTTNKYFSVAMDRVRDALSIAKGPGDLDAVNEMLNHYGAKSAYPDAATALLANHSGTPPNELGRFIRGANSILSATFLRLDFMNAANNAIGAQVLLGTETKFLLGRISAGDSSSVGALAKLVRISVPGTEDSIWNAGKMISQAYKNYMADDGTLLSKYAAAGIEFNLKANVKSMLDDLTVKGSEDAVTLQGKLGSALAKAKSWLSEAVDTGTKWTGNKFAEEMTRFVSANVMDQVSSIALQRGLISQSEQNGLLNSFVNKVNGNYKAGQRPLLFNGPVGQSIGLFQTYQFNMMQQLFKYVAEGNKKDVAMMLGLQGSLYGMNGLPAFQFINTHIVGTGSGNPNHTDFYSATYGIFGKQAGDWLMYGMPSNLLDANLYSRGDINPRQWTVIPVNPTDIPLVGATSKFFGNLATMVGRMNNGANIWNTFVQGLEHQGISRPLEGLAQELEAINTPGGQAFSTTSKASIVGSNDLFTMASLSRLSGARPFDEAVMNDAFFRSTTYAAADQDKMDALKEAVKVSSAGGSTPNMEDFLGQYLKYGGSPKNFNKWVLNNMKSANMDQADKMAGELKNPYAQTMQQLLGGSSIESTQVGATGSFDPNTATPMQE